jgi:hypothetical protein
MPFYKGYEGIYDQATLARLRDIFEFVWLAITDAVAPSVSREDIARLVVAVYEAGIPPDRIKEQVIAEILQRRVRGSGEAAGDEEPADSQK